MEFPIRIILPLVGLFTNLPTVNKLEPSYMKFINDPKTGVYPSGNIPQVLRGWRLDVADEFQMPDELRVTVKNRPKQRGLGRCDYKICL